VTTVNSPLDLVDILPRLWAFALRLSNDRRVAEELVERACLHGLQDIHPSQLHDTGMLTRLYATMYSMWSKGADKCPIRSRPRSKSGSDPIGYAKSLCVADPKTDAFYRKIVKAINSLPEIQRVVMLLAVVEQLTLEQAAGVLQIPIDMVRSHASQARLTIGIQFADDRPNQRTQDMTRSETMAGSGLLG
jgi:RNA polymerase sigma-70 factor, ECF subfamily